MNRARAPKMGTVKALLLLLARGIVLWLLVPLALVAWPIAWLASEARPLTPAAFVGWVDLNLIALLQRCLMAQDPFAMDAVCSRVVSDHRVGALDPV